MKRNLLLILCAALIALCLSGCVTLNFDGFNTVTGKGELESHQIKVGEYSGIKIEGLCEVRYYSAPSDTVTLEVQANLYELFTVEVKDGILVLGTTKRYTTGRTPVLTVSTPGLTSLNIAGAGRFTTYDAIVADSFSIWIGGAGESTAEFDVDSITVDMNGAGSFNLSGRADAADLNMAGAGSLNAIDLQTRDAKVVFSGAGLLKVNCSEKLKITANGAGKIEYSGSAVIDQNVNGVVSIKKVG